MERRCESECKWEREGIGREKSGRVRERKIKSEMRAFHGNRKSITLLYWNTHIQYIHFFIAIHNNFNI